jgi:hypothetical protein
MEYMSIETFRHFLAVAVFPPLVLCVLCLSFWLYLELRSQPQIKPQPISARLAPISPYHSVRGTLAGQAARVAHRAYLADLRMRRQQKYQRMKRYQKYQGKVQHWHRGIGQLQKVSLYAAAS